MVSHKDMIANLMNLVTKLRTLLCVLVLCTVSGAGASEILAKGRSLALERVAQRTGLPATKLVVINSAVVRYPIQDKTLAAFKVMVLGSGEIHGVTLGEDGREHDPQLLQAQEQLLHFAKYGRLDPSLAASLQKAPDDRPVDVIIWLKETFYKPSVLPSPDSPEGQALRERPDAAESFLAREDARRAKAVQPVVAPIMERLAKQGRIARAEKYDPVLYVTLMPREIREAARWPEVDRIYSNVFVQSDMDVAIATVQANFAHSLGFTGAGIKVAQIEGGGRVATDNPYLSGVIQDTTYVCPLPSDHSTAVAGIIRSTHSPISGSAPGVTLWAGGSCSGDLSQLQERSTAAADWGAVVLNLSWGSNTNRVPGPADRFYDSMVRNRSRTVVKSSGSACRDGTAYVNSPGLAYNVITVGNFDDRDTVSRGDDVMYNCSAWEDPTSRYGDREKPEVAAPGTKITTASTSSPWVGAVVNGTSFASPLVAGMAAVSMQYDYGLALVPEAMKAVLMATSMANIEGAQALSEYDGAGGVDARRALLASNNDYYNFRGYGCHYSQTTDVKSMNLTAGVRTRAVIVWDTDPNYSNYASEPGADLDLHVVMNGQVIATSASWDNTYEIVDFTPSSTGSAMMRVVKYRCTHSPTRLGYAYFRD